MTGPLTIVLSSVQLTELADLVADRLRGQSSAQGLTVAQVAARLAVSRATVVRMISDGRLPACKVGNRTIVKATDVDALLSASVRTSAADDSDDVAAAREVACGRAWKAGR